jgi:hypothetical protein
MNDLNIKSLIINNNLNVIENSYLNNILCQGKLSVKGITNLENTRIKNLLIAKDISVNSTLFTNNINILGKINNDEFTNIINKINNIIPNELVKLENFFNHIIKKNLSTVSHIFKKHDKKFNDLFDLITIQHITNNLITKKINIIKQEIQVITQQINVINKKLDQFEPVVINDEFILPLNINMIVLINKSTNDIKITSNNGNIYNPFYCDPNGSDVTFIPRKSTFTFRYIDNEWYF